MTAIALELPVLVVQWVMSAVTALSLSLSRFPSLSPSLSLSRSRTPSAPSCTKPALCRRVSELPPGSYLTGGLLLEMQRYTVEEGKPYLGNAFINLLLFKYTGYTLTLFRVGTLYNLHTEKNILKSVQFETLQRPLRMGICVCGEVMFDTQLLEYFKRRQITPKKIINWEQMK